MEESRKWISKLGLETPFIQFQPITSVKVGPLIPFIQVQEITPVKIVRHLLTIPPIVGITAQHVVYDLASFAFAIAFV